MALGRDDVQPAEVDDLLVLGVGLALERAVDALVRLPRHPVEMVDVVEVDELVVVDELLLPLGQLFRDLIGQRLLTSHELGVAAEQDVGAAARHVGGDGDRALAAGLSDDLGFLRVVLRVEDDVADAAELQQLREPLGLLDRDRADERRAAVLLLLDDVGDDRLVLFLLRAVDRVRLFDALELAVGRDDHHVELVDLVELFGLGVGRAGHARELAVHAEVVLEGDVASVWFSRSILTLLLRLDRLVQAVAPAAARASAGP